MADGTIFAKRDEGQALWMLGSLYDVKVGSDATGGALTVIEMTIPPGQGTSPPPHKHDGGEAAYVLEGTVRFHSDGQTFEASQGSFVYFPKGTLEWPEATGNVPARILAIYAPGRIDKFFAEVAEPAKTRTLPPPPSGPPDVEKLVAAGKKYGLELEAPPH